MAVLVKCVSGVLPVAYTLLFCRYAALLFCAQRDAAPRCAMSRAGAALALLHVAGLFLRGAYMGRGPLIGGWEIISFLALAILVTHLVVECWTGFRTPGVAALGLATILQTMASSLWGYERGVAETARHVWVHLHVSLGIGGHAGFLTAAAYALVYLTLYLQIKNRRHDRLWERLPPLESMHRMAYRAVALGLALFTVGMGVGVFRAWVDGRWPEPLYSGGVSWLVYVLLLAVGRLCRFSGRRFAVATLVAAVINLIALVFTGILHSRHLGL